MKKIINKKGALSETDKILFWVLFVIPACGLIVSLIFIAMPKLIDAQTSMSQELKQQIYISTITGSPLCFAHEDKTINRVYNGHIDLEKVTEQNLQNCLKIERITELGFFVSVHKDGALIKEIETANVLRRIGARSIIIEQPVIIIEENQKHNGFLRFTFY